MPFRLVKSTVLILLAASLLWACQAAPTLPAAPAAGTTIPSASATPLAAGPAATRAPTPTPGESPLAPASKDRYAKVDPKGQKIVYWDALSGKNQAALQKIVTDFNASNPEGITVEAVGLGSEDAIFAKMQALMNSKDQPGLMDASQSHAAIYQLSSDLEDLNGLVTSAKWGLTTNEYNDFPSGVMAQDIHTLFVGERLGFPVSRSMDLLYANQDWLKELGLSEIPKSPQEFKTAACKAAQQPYSKGSTQDGPGIGLLIPRDAGFFIPWINASGADIFGTANNFYTLETDTVAKAAVFIQELVKEGCAQLSPDNAAAQRLFGAGQALFLFGSTDELAPVSSAAAQGRKFTWTVGPLPNQGANPVVTVTGPSLSIPKSTPEQELAAWIFIKYLASPAVQAEWGAASGTLPVRGTAQADMSAYFTRNPAYKAAYDLLKYSKPDAPVPGNEKVFEKIDQAFLTIVSTPYPEAGPVLAQVNRDANQALQDLLAKRK